EFDTQVGTQIESEVKAEAKKKYAEVLDAAAQEAGFAVAVLPPYRRDIGDGRLEPYFAKRFDRTVVFLWGGALPSLELGECTDRPEDTVERRWQMAAVEQVEPLQPSDIRRREFEEQRHDFAFTQMVEAMRQSFTLEALKDRYSYADVQAPPKVAKQ